jgi:hypothetical protein
VFAQLLILLILKSNTSILSAFSLVMLFVRDENGSINRLVMQSSLIKKYLMALTGIVLVGFVFVHMAGNLQVLARPGSNQCLR